MITKKEIINQAWFLGMGIFTWIIVINGSKLVIDTVPIENQFIIGLVGIVILMFVKPNGVQR